MFTSVLSESLASSHHQMIPSSDLPLLLQVKGLCCSRQHSPHVRRPHDMPPRSPMWFTREESMRERVELNEHSSPFQPIYSFCFSCNSWPSLPNEQTSPQAHARHNVLPVTCKKAKMHPTPGAQPCSPPKRFPPL